MGNKLFGTDGVRGVANQYPMTAEFALKLAMAVGTLVCRDKKKVAIARDTRVSGEMLEAALASGFMAAGVDVVLLGVMPTPVLTSITASLGVDMAVMITASHNPYHDNGIKLIDAQGDKFSDEATRQIEAAIEAGAFALSAEHIGTATQMPDAVMLYADKLLEIAGENDQPLHGLRVVLDCANGAFYKLMPEVFKQLGAGVIVLGHEPDGLNINKDCGSQHIEHMQQVVREAHAHLGIACDGDGDRIIICDEQGNRLDGDQVLAFLGKYFKDEGRLKAHTVVVNMLSNPALDRFLSTEGIGCERTAVGERYVVERMKELGANIGGEESGHMVVADYSKTGDALVVGLILSLGLLKSGKKMSEIFPLFQPMAKKRVDSRFASKEDMTAAFELPAFQEAVREAERAVEGKGRLLVRKSGTEPKIQVWVWTDEAQTAAEVNQIVSAVLLQASGFVGQKEVL